MHISGEAQEIMNPKLLQNNTIKFKNEKKLRKTKSQIELKSKIIDKKVINENVYSDNIRVKSS